MADDSNPQPAPAAPKSWADIAHRYGPWVLAVLLWLVAHYAGGGNGSAPPPLPTVQSTPPPTVIVVGAPATVSAAK